MKSGPTSLILKSETDTAAFAGKVARTLTAGDVILLEGPIGAGKSAFARAVIRFLAGADIEVPSPTFTLVQTYPFSDFDVWHCDLYRLSHPDEAIELGVDAAFEEAVCLVEWPDRLGDLLPENALTLAFAATETHHTVSFHPSKFWAEKLSLQENV